MPGVYSDEFQAQRTFTPTQTCSSNFSLFSAHADIRNEYCSVLRFGRAFRVELYRMTKDSSGKTETLDISSNSQLEIKTATPINSILLPHIIEKVMVSSTDDIQWFIYTYRTQYTDDKTSRDVPWRSREDDILGPRVRPGCAATKQSANNNDEEDGYPAGLHGNS